jgi:hypothetical protein
LVVGAYWVGWRGWPLGLAAGVLLGAGQWLWVRYSVTRAFAPASGRPPRASLLWHSVLRLFTLGAVLLLLLKTPGVPIWAVLVGYALAQGAAAWLGRRGPRVAGRGVA